MNLETFNDKQRNILMYWLYEICNQYAIFIIENLMLELYQFGAVFEKQGNVASLNFNCK